MGHTIPEISRFNKTNSNTKNNKNNNKETTADEIKNKLAKTHKMVCERERDFFLLASVCDVHGPKH